jgi:hypothetical protein
VLTCKYEVRFPQQARTRRALPFIIACSQAFAVCGVCAAHRCAVLALGEHDDSESKNDACTFPTEQDEWHGSSSLSLSRTAGLSMDDPMSFEVRIDGRLVLGSMPTFSFSGLVDNAGASFTTHMLQFALLPDALCRERRSAVRKPQPA